MKISVARLKVVVNTPTRLIGDAREGRPVPHVGLPAKTAGPWRAWEAGCPVRARAGDHRAGAPGRCAKASKEGQGADAGAGSARSRAGAGRARAGAWWRRPGAHRAVGGRSPGAGPASTPDGRSEDPPAGVGGRRRGSRGKYLKESMPLLPGLLEGAGEIRRRAPPRTRPSGPGRVATSATGHRPPPLPRPRPAPCAAGPRPMGQPPAAQLHQGPQGRPVRPVAEPGPLRGRARLPTAVRCSKRGAKPMPLSTTDVLTSRVLTRSIHGRRRQDALDRTGFDGGGEHTEGSLS